VQGKINTSFEKLDVLTSLRFFAAFAVFIFHAKLLDSLLADYRLGDVGVAFFFLLSGFIMVYVYHEKLGKFTRKGLLKFYIARFAKIYPMHILAFLLATPAMFAAYGVVVGGPFNAIVAQAAAVNLSLTQAYFSDVALLYSFNNVSWTLSMEILFYAVFPIIMLIASKRLRAASIQRIIGIGIALWVITILFNFVLPASLAIGPIIRLPEFLIGSLAGFIYLNRPALGALIRKSRATTLEVTAILLAIGNLALYPLLPEKTTIAVCVAPSFIFLITVFAYQRGYISQLLSRRTFVSLGEISFSFYMLHMIILGRMGAIDNTSLTFLALGITLILSAVTYRYVEEPARKWLKFNLDKAIEKRRQRRLALEPVLDNTPA